MWEDDEFRRIPSHTGYFISKDGKLRRMEHRGRKPIIRPNINGELEVVLWERGYRQGKYKVNDLIVETWFNGETSRPIASR
jgi:hypothetical protein